VTAPQLVGLEVLPPILAVFCSRYPKIELELTISDHNEDLLRREADIAVRMARPKQQLLIARRIGMVEVGLFAHREYAAAFGLPAVRPPCARPDCLREGRSWRSGFAHHCNPERTEHAHDAAILRRLSPPLQSCPKCE